MLTERATALSLLRALVAQGLIPAPLQGASHQPVLRLDRLVLPLGPLDRVAGAKIGDFNGEDSPARRAGLEPNDVIVAVNGQPVDRVSTLQRLIRAYEPGTTVKLTVMRYGDRREFDVRLAEAPAREAQVARAPVVRPDSLVTASSEKLGVAVAPVPADWARSLNLSQVPAGTLQQSLYSDADSRVSNALARRIFVETTSIPLADKDYIGFDTVHTNGGSGDFGRRPKYFSISGHASFGSTSPTIASFDSG